METHLAGLLEAVEDEGLLGAAEAIMFAGGPAYGFGAAVADKPVMKNPVVIDLLTVTGNSGMCDSRRNSHGGSGSFSTHKPSFL